MTQKESIIKALELLGGKAKMSDICKLAKSIGDFSGSKDQNATIRNCIYTHPRNFLPSEQKDYWELASYQEEIATLKAKLKEKDEIIDKLQKRPSEVDFIDRFLEKLKTAWKNEKKTINEIRKILDAMGRVDVVEKMDACLDGKTKKSQKQVKNVSPKIFIDGDYVVTKHVDNEVTGVASGATGVIINEKQGSA